MALSPSEQFVLTKTVWSDSDFDQMGWHDVHVHAMAFATSEYELLMDIDYMFAWVDPEPPAVHYSFWMSPCTLIFRNVHSFNARIEWGLGLEISHVAREDAGTPRNAEYIKENKEWKWIFDCQEGEFSFVATGYTQITRRPPVRAASQHFPWTERGGVSFDHSPYDQK
jgi:hypothetical protein